MRGKGLLLIFLFFSFVSIAGSEPINGTTALDVSARLSRDLKTRLQEHLDKIFSSGKSEVFVQVDVGFSPTIKADLEKTLKSYLAGEAMRAEGAAAGAANSGSYQWLFPGLAPDQAGASESYILPGYSMQGGAPGTAAAPSARVATPFADPNFLYAIGLEVKRVFVKVALDYSLDSDAETKVQALAGALLDLDPQRGDKLIVTRFHMPNPIFELFKNPEFLGIVLKWAAISILILAGLILAGVIAVLVLKTTVGQLERWVEAVSMMRHRTVEFKFDLPPWLRESFPAIRIQKEEQIDSRGERRLVGGGTVVEDRQIKAEELRDLTIKIPKEKTSELIHLIGKEQPAHIALVLAKLPPDTRNEFLGQLPADRRSQVLAALASPQFVEPHVLWRLKEELEKRISGIVGGEEEMVRTLEATNLMVRLSILRNLEAENPVLFKAIRKRILLFEDLASFAEQELGHLLSRLSVQDLTLALANGEAIEGLKGKILRSLPKKTAQTVEELLALTGKPSQQKSMEAQDKIIRAAQKLIGEGTLRHPLVEAALT